MEATWLPIVFNMLVDFLHCCPIVQNAVSNVSVDQVLKDLSSLHIILAALRCVLCRQGSPSSVSLAVAGVTQMSMTKVTSNARRNGPVGVVLMVYQMMPFLPLN